MKQIGGVTYIGVSLKDLNKYFKEDAVIHVSKKFLKSYEMISGVTEQSKVISIPEPAIAVVKVDTAIEPEREIAPPVDVKESKGDW